MPQQLPQIAILPARYPDLGKAIFQHQLQNQLRILAIRLLLAYSLRIDLGGVSDPQLKLQLGEQSFKPARMPARFHPHTHLHPLCRELTVKLLRFLTVLQSPLLQFPSLGIHKSNLLEARVVIASYNDHCSAPFSRAFLVGLAPPKFTRAWEPTLSWNQLHSLTGLFAPVIRSRGNLQGGRYSSASGSMEMFFSPWARFSQYFFTQASKLLPAAVSRTVKAIAAISEKGIAGRSLLPASITRTTEFASVEPMRRSKRYPVIAEPFLQVTVTSPR